MERGGYATTWSMRFQNLWAVEQLLLLLAEELRSVRIEPAGVEGEGVDIVVTLPDGVTEYQQCKRSYRHAGKWPLGALEDEGVLSAICSRLRADPGGKFRLVSVDPAPELRDLTESARASLDPTSFLRDQVGGSAGQTKAFNAFCGSLGLDHIRSDELAEAHSLLSRTFTTVAGDDEGKFRELQSRCRYWIDGSPDGVLAALKEFADETLRRAITTVDVESFLVRRGFHLRVLARDSRVLPGVRRLQESFDASLAGQLVNGRLLPRDETRKLIELLENSSGERFVAVHGPAGVGKSGVLLDLSEHFRSRSIPYLPIRLDRQRPSGSTRQFGESLDLPESPALCLEAVSGEGSAVLILDQLDALRWTGAQAAQALETCRQLVKEALRHPRLRVVACCRTFDLENDPQIRSWIGEHKARKLRVDRLSRTVVSEIVSAAGVAPQTLTERQMDLLRTIQHLRSWEETVRVTGGAVGFGTERELLDAFWRSRLLEAERMGISASVVQQAVDDIVTFMESTSDLVAPRRLFLGRPHVESVLFSLNVLAPTGDAVSFCHQTYLDHQLAHLLLRRIDDGEATVGDWLTGAHQGLYRREQLRLVLGMLREERFEHYLTTLKGLLVTGAVRFHLKQLVLQFLGQLAEPRPGEIDLILALLPQEEWREHVIADVVYGHPAWFLAVDRAGHLANWIDGEGGEPDQALGLIRSVVEDLGEQCYQLVGPLANRNAQWSSRVAAVLTMAPAKDSPSLFELRVQLAERGAHNQYIDWKGLSGPNLPRLTRLLDAILSNLEESGGDPPPPGGIFHGLEEVELSESSLAELVAAWKALIPRAAQTMGREVEDDDTLSIVEHRDWRLSLRELLRRIAAELILREPWSLLNLVDNTPNRLGELLVLEALRGVENLEAAERALEWLTAKPSRLRRRWSGSDLPWEVSRRAVEQLTRCCSPSACRAFESFILELPEPQLRRSLEIRHEYLLSPPEGHRRFADGPLAWPSRAGQTAYHLLPALPAERMSAAGQRRLAELQRKFAGVDEVFFAGWGKGQGGSVGSPLPNERLNALSDKVWLQIIRRNAAPRPDARWSRRFRDGRFEESTPEAFSSDLGTATAREPGRFTRLPLQFPADANPIYFHAIVRGLRAEAAKNSSAPQPTVANLEALLNLPQVRDDSSSASDVAWLVGNRADLDWSVSTLDLLAAIATQHPDPAEGTLPLHGSDWEDWGPESLANNALNCARGAATFALARLLFADPRRLEVLSDSIERIVLDPHPAVRVASFDCCLAMLQPDHRRAIDSALRASEGHESLLACSYFDRFLRFASGRHPTEMEATLLRMLASPREDVVQVGARHTAGQYLVHGRMTEAAHSCLHGTVAQRRGVAQVAAALADSSEYHDRARPMLIELINDDAAEVLQACGEAFRDTTLDLFAEAPDFLDAYASSRAFLLHPIGLLHRLREHNGSLVPFASCILTICQRLTASPANVADQKHGALWGVDYYLPPILLRLYEQAPNGSTVRELCLDAWDVLLKARAVSAISLTKQLESDS